MSVFFWDPRRKWIVQWVEGGKKKRKYLNTEQEARAFDIERLSQFEDQRLTVGELAASYFRSNPDKHEKTKRNIVYFLAGHEEKDKHIEGVGEFLRDKYVESLTRFDLEMMREAFRSKGTSNATINKYQAYLKAIISWGIEQQLINHNPWRDFKRLKTQTRIVRATLADFQKIISFCPDWLRWALATAYALALRPGHVELFSLRWDAFNWKFGVVILSQGKTGRIKKVMPPKSYLEEARIRYEQDYNLGIPLVVHRKGRRVIDYKTAWHKAVVDAGLEHRGLRMYDIRHLAASGMLGEGADLAAVAAQMGHASTQTTASTYAHVTPGGQPRAAALLPKL